jgi:hypothetical protein
MADLIMIEDLTIRAHRLTLTERHQLVEEWKKSLHEGHHGDTLRGAHWHASTAAANQVLDPFKAAWSIAWPSLQRREYEKAIYPISHAVLALSTHHLIGTLGYTQEHFALLYRPWQKVTMQDALCHTVTADDFLALFRELDSPTKENA